jgi:hypothetical protein
MSAGETEKKKQVDAVHIELVHSCVSEIAREFDAELDALIDSETKKNSDENQKRKMSMAFVHLVLKASLGIDDADAHASLTDGYRDFGIDAVHIGNVTEDDFEITVAQGKYVFDPSKAQGSMFPENDGIAMVIPGVRFITKKNADIPANNRLAEKIERIRHLKQTRIPKIRVLICNNGLKWSPDAQARIDMEQFGKRINWEHVNPHRLAEHFAARKVPTQKLNFVGDFIEENFHGTSCLIGRMRVSDIATLVNQCGDSLFDPNVRGFLGTSRSRVNEGILKTLMDQKRRKNFYLFNNGLTMVCESMDYDAEDDSDLMVKVDGLSVINGGQTCRTIQHAEQQCIMAGQTLEDASVLVRLYAVPENAGDLSSQIAFCTNSQNPVDLRDLRSGDSIQRSLEEAVARYGYSYHRLRADKVIRGAKKIPAPLAAEAILCVWRRMPFEAAAHKQEHFSDRYYNQIYSSDLTAGQLILATKILRSSNSRSSQKSDSSPICLHGSHLLATVMGHLLLKELNYKLDDIQRDGFEKADLHFEKTDHLLFDRALKQVESAIKSYVDDDSPYSESELPKLFRKARFVKGHLLKEIKGAAE